MHIPAPIIRAAVKTVCSMGLRPETPLNIQRKGIDALGGHFPLAKNVQLETTTVLDMPAWWHIPKGAPEDKVIIYFHGGVYCVGSPKSHRDLCSYLAKYANTKLVAIDYKLAPETHFPEGINSAIDAYKAILDLGYDSQNIVIAGDSAGGGICLATLQYLRDNDLPMPSGAFLISPWLDLQNQLPTHKHNADIDPMLTTHLLNALGDLYMNGETKANQMASPLMADVTGLPPLYVQVGSDEILLDDSIVLEEKAKAANVDITCDIYQNRWHVFQFTPTLSKDARSALEKAGGFIQKTLTTH